MDEDSFAAFYDQTARPLWAYLARITGSRQAADDLLQEAYYRLLRGNETFHSDAHRRNTLFRIATNLARDSYRRSRAAGTTVPVPEDHEHLALREPVDVASRAVQRTDFNRALAQLKPRERQLLWLAYSEGLTHEEIAAVLSLKTGSLKMLLYRARRRFAALLRGEK